jgi:hypothetical protein
MIGAWFMARLMPIGLGLALVVGIVAWDRVRIWNAETRGEDRAIVKLEKNNARVSSAARNAGRKSLDPQSGGLLNPYYRD